MDNEFAPFRDARARIRGGLKTAQDVFFTTYQALSGNESSPPLYKRYPKNYFDLIIIDECHRGSAQDDSNWRKILEHFDAAVQIGMTATPLRDDNINTYRYFGRPLAVYSLRQGISDGYLAPYRVRRVLTDRAAEEQEQIETLPEGPEPSEDIQESTAQERSNNIDDESAAHEPFNEIDDESPSCEPPNEVDEVPVIRFESGEAMVSRTDVIAAHLARKLRESDTTAKTVVFCVDQEHADSMRTALEREFPAEIESFKARGENFIERIVSDEKADGKRALGKFCDSETDAPVIVTTQKLLSTGIDIPPCKNIVIARPVRSIVEFKQIIGRGTRLDEPRKMWFTIIDYAGTTRHFYDPDFDGDPEFIEIDNLEGTEEPAPSEETGGAPSAQPEQPVDSAPTSSSAEGDETSPEPLDPTASLTAASTSAQETVAATHPSGASSDFSRPTGSPVNGASTTSPTSNGALSPEPDRSNSTEPGAVSTTDDVRSTSADAAPAEPEQTRTDSNSTTGQEADDVANAEATRTDRQPDSAQVAAEQTEASAETQPVSESTDEPTGSETTSNATNPSRTRRGNRRARPRDGGRIEVVGEFVYELGPDGRTLRETPYLEYAKEAIGEDCPSLDNLRERWLRPELRTELQGRLAEAGVELEELAAVFNLADRDPIDVVAHALFRLPVPTRQDRIDRLKERHLHWLNGFEPGAREVLDLIIEKYIAGEAHDVTDTGLLKVPPLSLRGTFLELAQRFGNGAALRDALAELSRRLYQD